jgi:dihydroorotase
MIVITGARVLSTEGWKECDVSIEHGVVKGMGRSVPRKEDAIQVDGSGMVLGPGFVDLHTHLREPGEVWKEDMVSATAGAGRGGFTAIMAMPNTNPPTDSGDSVRWLRRRAMEVAAVDVGISGALSLGRSGEFMSHLDEMYEEGVRMFTDDGDALMDGGLLRRIMKYLSDRPDVVVAQHAEDPAIAANGHLHEGRRSQTLGLVGLPSSAEVTVIARDLALADEIGTHYHVQHISAAASVELVRQAKGAGVKVTAEVTPHHLQLCEDDVVDLDTNMKMYPPLRSRADREALVEGLRDGTIDAVATDHAPHADSEKDVPFEDAPRGVIGLETAFPATLAALDGDLDLVFDRMSVMPAQIGGFARHGHPLEEGSAANLVLVDPSAEWVAGGFASPSNNSPFLGRELKGRVVATIVDGGLIYGDAS